MTCLWALRQMERKLLFHMAIVWHLTALNLLKAFQQGIACCVQLHCVLPGTHRMGWQLWS
jgi:hypothetical protein